VTVNGFILAVMAAKMYSFYFFYISVNGATAFSLVVFNCT